MTFFFHYNKPASQKAGKPQISLHYRKQCIIADNLICNVPTWGVYRKTQPRFVMKGKASTIRLEGNQLIID